MRFRTSGSKQSLIVRRTAGGTVAKPSTVALLPRKLADVSVTSSSSNAGRPESIS
jgi:hypothetical protein